MSGARHFGQCCGAIINRTMGDSPIVKKIEESLLLLVACSPRKALSALATPRVWGGPLMTVRHFAVDHWPTARWPCAALSAVGIEAAPILALDAECARGDHGFVDGL